MKTSASLCLSLLLPLACVRADSFRFTETSTDRVQAVRMNGQTGYTTVTHHTASLVCSLYLPGVGGQSFDADTPMSFTLGQWSFSGLGSQATRKSEKSASFVLTLSDGQGHHALQGTVTFGRHDRQLMIAATTGDYGDSALVQAYSHLAGPITGQTTFTATVGPFSVSRTLYLGGSNRFRTNTVFGLQVPLNAIRLVATADVTPPRLRFLTPRSGAQVGSEFPVSVSATDAYGVDAVFLALNSKAGQDFYPLSFDGTNWTTQLSNLAAGLNTVYAYGQDSSGNVSPIISLRLSVAP